MKVLSLTHATLNRPCEVNASLLFSWYYSEAHKATVLISTNGGAIPVSESTERITQLIKETKENQNDIG